MTSLVPLERASHASMIALKRINNTNVMSERIIACGFHLLMDV